MRHCDANHLDKIIIVAIIKVILSCVIFWCNSVSANSAESVLSGRVKVFLADNFLRNHVGLVVQQLDSNKILARVNHGKLFVPASLTKLFTLATALKVLGSQFRFTTILYWNKQDLKNNVLSGDLALTFSGDPSFKQQDLENLLINLRQSGIKQIEGDLIVDDSLFSEQYANGWLIDDLTWGYAAPAEAIVIANNKIPIVVDPVNAIGQQVKFAIYEKYASLYTSQIESNVLGIGAEQQVPECKLKILVDAKNNIQFSGCIAVDDNQQHFALALHSPRKYLQDLLIIYLKKHNINLLGSILFKVKTKNFSHTIIHSSDNLSELAKSMMQYSDNIYAHSLGKALGAKVYGHGSFQTATKAITNILHKNFTVNTGTLNLSDSSGLSAYNVATPNHFIRLLQAIYNDKDLYRKISNILATPGNGTLNNRLLATDLCENVIAKTGELKHSAGLAGYIKTKQGQNLAFAFILNNLLENDFKTKQLIDEFIELLINYDE